MQLSRSAVGTEVQVHNKELCLGQLFSLDSLIFASPISLFYKPYELNINFEIFSRNTHFQGNGLGLVVYSRESHFLMGRHILEAELVEMYAKKGKRGA